LISISVPGGRRRGSLDCEVCVANNGVLDSVSIREGSMHRLCCVVATFCTLAAIACGPSSDAGSTTSGTTNPDGVGTGDLSGMVDGVPATDTAAAGGDGGAMDTGSTAPDVTGVTDGTAGGSDGNGVDGGDGSASETATQGGPVACKVDADCPGGSPCFDTPDGRWCAFVCGASDLCAEDYACVDHNGGKWCRHRTPLLCAPCVTDADCAPEVWKAPLSCVAVDGLKRCLQRCDNTVCVDETATCGPLGTLPKVCQPVVCPCVKQGAGGCEVANEAGACVGTWSCDAGKPTICNAATPVAENCNAKDDDCDGATDEDGATGCAALFPDTDGDGFGSGAGACLCAGAGLVTVGGDCDDTNKEVSPTATEACADAVDNDCDGQTDEANAQGCTPLYEDKDNDGFGVGTPKCYCAKAGFSEKGGDCDDGAPGANPSKTEECGNAKDDNCDGATDEPGAQGCIPLYEDKDDDGFGIGSAQCLCEAKAPYTATQAGDCKDDYKPQNPNAKELCDGVDNDCDGQTDEENATGCAQFYVDADGDGFGSGQLKCLCAGPGKVSKGGDCDDTIKAVNPNAKEDCTTQADENCGDQDLDATGCALFFEDNDGDGFGAGAGKCYCAATAPYVAPLGGDCDDTTKDLSPGVAEVCDGVDNNCNGVADDGLWKATSSTIVTTGGDSFHPHFGPPALARLSDGSYVVVATTDEIISKVYGWRLDKDLLPASGSVGLAQMPPPVKDGFSYAMHPRASTDGTNVMVSFRRLRDAGWTINCSHNVDVQSMVLPVMVGDGTLSTPGLKGLGPQLSLGICGIYFNRALGGAPVWNGSDYSVAWIDGHEGSGNTGHVYVGTIALDGTANGTHRALPELSDIVTPPDVPDWFFIKNRNVQLAVGADNALVAWLLDKPGAAVRWALYDKKLTSAIGGPQTTATGDFAQVTTAAYSNGRYLVVAQNPSGQTLTLYSIDAATGLLKNTAVVSNPQGGGDLRAVPFGKGFGLVLARGAAVGYGFIPADLKGGPVISDLQKEPGVLAGAASVVNIDDTHAAFTWTEGKTIRASSFGCAK